MSEHFLNKLKSIRQRYGIEKAQNNNFIKIDDRQYQQQVPENNQRRQFSVRKQDSFNKKQQQRQPSLIMYDNNKQVGQKQQKAVIHRSQSTFNKQRQFLISQFSHFQHPTQQRQLAAYLVNTNSHSIQNNRKSTDRLFRQKDYNRAARANNYICNQPQCLAQKFNNNSRTFSQQKSQQFSLMNNNNNKKNNNYDLKYNYDLQNVNNLLSSKSNFTSQSLHHRQPLRLNNRNLIDEKNLNFNNYDALQKAKYQTLGQSHRQGSFSYGGNRQQSKPDWTIDKLCKVQEKIQAYLRR